ncbi:MAG: hypothetical protein ABJJ53_09375 [Sulfitobacter sp.]
MRRILHQFFRDTSGAVTVDWVVLSAAGVGLGLMAAASISDGAIDMGENLNDFMTTDENLYQNQ